MKARRDIMSRRQKDREESFASAANDEFALEEDITENSQQGGGGRARSGRGRHGREFRKRRR